MNAHAKNIMIVIKRIKVNCVDFTQVVIYRNFKMRSMKIQEK